MDPDAGFPGLLARVWRDAAAEQDLSVAVSMLLTLGGCVPADIQLAALSAAEECAMTALFDRSWREERRPRRSEEDAAAEPAFPGAIGLSVDGRVVLAVPSGGALPSRETLVDGVRRVPWTSAALSRYTDELAKATRRAADETSDCRRWLAAAGPEGRDELLTQLGEAARRTAPFILYSGQKRYTNFRELNNLPGKTLWPGHPDCVLSSLHGIPLEAWADSDVVLVVCLSMLIRSAGFARIEEANGTQLTVGHVAWLLERTRRMYDSVSGGRKIPSAPMGGVRDLMDLADALLERRGEVVGSVQLYREIHGPLMHKVERVAGAPGAAARETEEHLCALLRERLPITGTTLEELADSVTERPDWLSGPHGEFGTGLESLIYETATAAMIAFDADFAMSRGMRSLPRLMEALREQDWARITRWDLPEFFCCVVPAADAGRLFGESPAHLADIAWSISARMQYNSWHFLAGNLPKGPEVVSRDYFVPPTLPDIAYYSDQHHHGHVAARVRFSVRSPQAVKILGKTFNGFVDLRLLRCDGLPFGEQELLVAHRTSAFIARVTSAAASLVADGRSIEVTSFDPGWHSRTITGAVTRASGNGGVSQMTLVPSTDGDHVA